MGNQSKLAVEVQRVRKRRLLSQQELAQLVGCGQTAISRFESGEVNAISIQTAERICKALSIDLELLDRFAEVRGNAFRLVCCANFDCSKNLPILMDGNVYVQPWMSKAVGNEVLFCPGCGKPMIDMCQHAHCQEPLLEGAAFCFKCGAPYASTPDAIRSMKDPMRYFEIRLEQHSRLREFQTAGRFSEGRENPARVAEKKSEDQSDRHEPVKLERKR